MTLPVLIFKEVTAATVNLDSLAKTAKKVQLVVILFFAVKFIFWPR